MLRIQTSQLVSFGDVVVPLPKFRPDKYFSLEESISEMSLRISGLNV